MPVQAPGALQEQVHRRQVGEHEVKVNIQRLFRYLGRHQQGPLGALPLLAEAVEHLAFQASALVFGKTRMEQQQAGFLADLCLQQAIESLRAVYGVDDNYATAAMGQGLQRLFGDTWEASVTSRRRIRGSERAWQAFDRTPRPSASSKRG